MFEKFKKLEKPQRLSRIYGFLIGIGLFVILIGVLDSIKITPYSVYTSRRGEFQIKYPSYWTVIHDAGLEGVGYADVSFLSPRINNLDALQENVSIVIQHVPEELKSIEKFTEQMVWLTSTVFKEHIEILQSVPITISGLPGYRFTFAGRAAGRRDMLEMPSILYSHAWVLVGDKDYMISFIGMESEYPAYKKKYETMLKSFKFITPEQQAAQP